MKSRVRGIVKGTVFSLAVTLLLAVLLAAVMYFCTLPEIICEICICMAGAVSCALGAFAVAKANGSRGLLMGGCVGIMYFAVLVAASVIITKNLSLSTHNVIILVMSLFSGMLGGVLAMPRD